MVANISAAQLSAISIPSHTRSWYPIPHSSLVDEVRSQVISSGLTITKETHEIDHGGESYFGKLFIGGGREEAAGYNFVLGVRNSNGKKFAAGLCGGSHVTVCSNLCFSGEVTLARKHTRYIMRDLPHMVYNTLEAMSRLREKQFERFDAYKNQPLGDLHMSALLIRAMEEGVISSSQISKVWAEWKAPQHEEFQPRNVYSAMNAFTEIFKTVNPMSVNSRGNGLHILCDRASKVLAA